MVVNSELLQNIMTCIKYIYCDRCFYFVVSLFCCILLQYFIRKKPSICKYFFFLHLLTFDKNDLFIKITIYVYVVIVINHKDMLFTGKTACYVCAPRRKQTGNVVLLMRVSKFVTLSGSD